MFIVSNWFDWFSGRFSDQISKSSSACNWNKLNGQHRAKRIVWPFNERRIKIDEKRRISASPWAQVKKWEKKVWNRKLTTERRMLTSAEYDRFDTWSVCNFSSALYLSLVQCYTHATASNSFYFISFFKCRRRRITDKNIKKNYKNCRSLRNRFDSVRLHNSVAVDVSFLSHACDYDIKLTNVK